MPIKIGKYVFVLNGINVEEINERYRITPGIKIEEEAVQPKRVSKSKKKITRISDLNSKNSQISFVDSAKTVHQCVVSGVDLSKRSHGGAHIYQCFWDHHILPLGAVPLSCPTRYIPPKIVKTYTSEISRDVYTIIEPVTKEKLKGIFQEGTDVLDIEDQGTLSKIENGFYECDGIFCSWDCMWAWAKRESKIDPMFIDSCKLILKMYNDTYGTSVTTLAEAPHWRTLLSAGGKDTIDEFRNNTNHINQKSYGNIKSLPIYRPIGWLYEKQLKF